MMDEHSEMSLATLIGNAVLAADNTPASVSLRGFNSCEIILAIGIGGITFDGTNKIEFKLTHSDDDAVYNAVTVTDMIGLASVGAGGIIKALTAAHPAAASYRFGYIGDKPFLKLLADFSGTHATGTSIAAVAARGHASHAPTVNQP